MVQTTISLVIGEGVQPDLGDLHPGVDCSASKLSWKSPWAGDDDDEVAKMAIQYACRLDIDLGQFIGVDARPRWYWLNTCSPGHFALNIGALVMLQVLL